MRYRFWIKCRSTRYGMGRVKKEQKSEMKDKKDSMKTQLVATVLPLLGSSGSQTRILSQIIMNRIHPKGYQNDTSTNQDAVHTVLSPILKFLRENKDMVRMRIKQEKVFSTEIIDYKCSMEGLLATPMNSFGDFYDVPLIERVRDACIEYQRETEILHPERFFFRNPNFIRVRASVA